MDCINRRYPWICVNFGRCSYWYCGWPARLCWMTPQGENFQLKTSTASRQTQVLHNLTQVGPRCEKKCKCKWIKNQWPRENTFTMSFPMQREILHIPITMQRFGKLCHLSSDQGSNVAALWQANHGGTAMFIFWPAAPARLSCQDPTAHDTLALLTLISNQSINPQT